jgi:large subunit ribosomal protein L25
METIKLTLLERETGKKGVKSARKAETIPVEIYGKTLEKNISGSIERKELVKALNTPRGKNVVIEVEHDGKTIKTIPHNLQIHPVKTKIIHMDLLAVRDDEDVFLTVPVIRKGRSKGEVAGGKVFQVMKEVKVVCKPDKVPAAIEVDITENVIGDRIKISALPYPEGVKPVFRQDTPVIVINKGRGQSVSDEEEEAAAEATPAAE